LLAASEEVDVELMRSMLEQGADINARNANFGTPLHRAAFRKVETLYDVHFRGSSRDREGDLTLVCATWEPV